MPSTSLQKYGAEADRRTWGVLYGDRNIRTSVMFALCQRRSSGELIDPARSFILSVSLAEAALTMQVEHEGHRARRVPLAVSVRERVRIPMPGQPESRGRAGISRSDGPCRWFCQRLFAPVVKVEESNGSTPTYELNEFA